MSIATLLTVASLLGLTWQSMHLQVCSIVDLGKSMAFLALTLLCMLLSLLLWMRVALACMQGLQMDIRRELSGRDLAAMLAAEGGDAADESGGYLHIYIFTINTTITTIMTIIITTSIIIIIII